MRGHEAGQGVRKTKRKKKWMHENVWESNGKKNKSEKKTLTLNEVHYYNSSQVVGEQGWLWQKLLWRILITWTWAKTLQSKNFKQKPFFLFKYTHCNNATNKYLIEWFNMTYILKIKSIIYSWSSFRKKTLVKIFFQLVSKRCMGAEM